MKVVCIIQARMGSSRLPGKVLMDIAGAPMLARVVARVLRAAALDKVVVATTENDQDEALVDFCQDAGVPCWRGDEQDVLSRYLGAARAHEADAVVRVTSDCPLIEPRLIDRVVDLLRGGGCDYASTTLKRTYPRGLDVEAFTMESFERLALEVTEEYERVHVTPRYYQNPDRFHLSGIEAEQDYSDLRWTVDTPADIALVREIYTHFEGRDDFDWRQVLALVESRPELTAINAEIRQKELKDL